MAFVEDSYQTLTLQLKDREEKHSSLSIRFSALADIGAFLTAIPTVVVPAVQAISDCVVDEWTLTRHGRDAAAAQAPETAEVQRKGVFTMLTDNGFPVVFSVPGIKNTMVIDRTDQINLADAAIIAFVNLLNGTTLLDTAFAVSNRDEPIDLVKSAVKRHNRVAELGR